MSEAHFIDTSALVKRYVDEAGTAALRDRCFSAPETEIFVSALAYAEAHATFARLLRDGGLTVAEHQTIAANFAADWRTFVVVEFGPHPRALVPELARAHSLRGADLVQLASALYMQSRRALALFVCCDLLLCNAAVLTGLPLFNPELPASG
jgi:hypothetical protein